MKVHEATISLATVIGNLRAAENALYSAQMKAIDCLTGLWNSDLPGVGDSVRRALPRLQANTRESISFASEARAVVDSVRAAVSATSSFDTRRADAKVVAQPPPPGVSAKSLAEAANAAFSVAGS
jgi:hypothetical protein